MSVAVRPDEIAREPSSRWSRAAVRANGRCAFARIVVIASLVDVPRLDAEV